MTTETILFHTCKGSLLVPVQQVIRIQSISCYSKIFFSNGKTEVVTKVLRWFQKQPALSSFVRIHRTHLVNIDYIANYKNGHRSLLHLSNGEQLVVARRKKAEVREQLSQCICYPEKKFHSIDSIKSKTA